VPGERLSPTQPFPTHPPPFDQQGISIEELIDFTPELRAEAEAILADVDYGGLFSPPSERGTINIPGWFGSGNWHGAAFDPETGFLYVPSSTNPIRVRLAAPDPATSDFNYVRVGGIAMSGPRGLPLTKPPYGRMTAYDLNTGDIEWVAPLGDGVRQRLIDMGVPDPGPLGGGGYTGPLLTETLLFIGQVGNEAAGRPSVLWAFDKETGQVVHETVLPAGPTGTPMTYLYEGRQYIVMAYGAGSQSGLLGLALPPFN